MQISPLTFFPPLSVSPPSLLITADYQRYVYILMISQKTHSIFRFKGVVWYNFWLFFSPALVYSYYFSPQPSFYETENSFFIFENYGSDFIGLEVGGRQGWYSVFIFLHLYFFFSSLVLLYKKINKNEEKIVFVLSGAILPLCTGSFLLLKFLYDGYFTLED